MSTELIPLEGATSAVWKYFGFPAKNGFIQPDKKKRNKVNCKLCMKVITYSGNTTNMRVHLRDNHHKVYSDLLQSEKEKSSTSKSGGIEKQQTIAQAQYCRPCCQSKTGFSPSRQSIWCFWQTISGTD